MGLLGGGGTFRKWEIFRPLGVCPWRGWWDSSPFLLLFCFLTMKWAVCSATDSSALLSGMPIRGPKHWGLPILDWKLNQNKPFLFISWLSQVFHYRDGKLTNTRVKTLAAAFLHSTNSKKGEFSSTSLFLKSSVTSIDSTLKTSRISHGFPFLSTMPVPDTPFYLPNPALTCFDVLSASDTLPLALIT